MSLTHNAHIYNSKTEIKSYLDEFWSHFPLVHHQFLLNWEKVFNDFPLCSYKLLALIENNKLVGILPFVEYDGKYGKIINSMPHIAYGGPLVIDLKYTEELIKEFLNYAQDNNFVSTTICTPPLFNDEYVEKIKKAFNPDYVNKNFFQYSRLDTHPLQQLSSKRRAAFKNEIKKSMDANLRLDTTVTKELWNKWINIYLKRYSEIGARAYPQEFFDGLYNHILPMDQTKMIFAYLDKELIGGTLLMYGNNIVDYFFTAFKSEYRKLYPGTFLLDKVFEECIKKGYEYFNWQSSPGKSGVYKYKARWGAKEGSHFYFTKVTGNIDSLIQTPLQKVLDNYNRIYVLPFDLWQQD